MILGGGIEQHNFAFNNIPGFLADTTFDVINTIDRQLNGANVPYEFEEIIDCLLNIPDLRNEIELSLRKDISVGYERGDSSIVNSVVRPSSKADIWEMKFFYIVNPEIVGVRYGNISIKFSTKNRSEIIDEVTMRVYKTTRKLGGGKYPQLVYTANYIKPANSDISYNSPQSIYNIYGGHPPYFVLKVCDN